MLVLIFLASWIVTWVGVALFLRRQGFSTGFNLGGSFVVSCGVLALVSTMLTEQTKEAEQPTADDTPFIDMEGCQLMGVEAILQVA
jgi:hypothetical protein